MNIEIISYKRHCKDLNRFLIAAVNINMPFRQTLIKYTPLRLFCFSIVSDIGCLFKSVA